MDSPTLAPFLLLLAAGILGSARAYMMYSYGPVVNGYHPYPALPLAHPYIPGLAPFGAASFLHSYNPSPYYPSAMPYPPAMPTYPGTMMPMYNPPLHSIPTVSMDPQTGQTMVTQSPGMVPGFLSYQRTPSTLTVTMSSPDCTTCTPDELPVATVTLSKNVDGKSVTQQVGQVSGTKPMTSFLVTDPITGLSSVHNIPGFPSTTPSTITVTMTSLMSKTGEQKKATATITLTSPPSISSPVYLPSTLPAMTGQVTDANGIPVQQTDPNAAAAALQDGRM